MPSQRRLGRPPTLERHVASPSLRSPPIKIIIFVVNYFNGIPSDSPGRTVPASPAVSLPDDVWIGIYQHNFYCVAFISPYWSSGEADSYVISHDHVLPGLLDLLSPHHSFALESSTPLSSLCIRLEKRDTVSRRMGYGTLERSRANSVFDSASSSIWSRSCWHSNW